MNRTEFLSHLFCSSILLFGIISIKSLLIVLPFLLFYVIKYGEKFTSSFRFYCIALSSILYVATGLITSRYTNNTLSISIDILLVMCAFLAISELRRPTEKHISLLFLIFNIIATIIVSSTLLCYLFHQSQILSLGLDDMTSFKHYYRPLFMLCNDNATMILCLEPFILLSIFVTKSRFRWWYIANMAMSSTALVVSYSRGIYLSVAIFTILLMAMVFLYNRQQMKCYLSTMAICVVVLSMILWGSSTIRNSVTTTIAFKKTESQKRSYDSRIASIEKNIAKSQNIFWGEGDGNYFKYNIGNRTSYDTILSASAKNGIVQLFIERGIVGILLVFGLGCIVFKTAYSEAKKGSLIHILMLCGLVAFCIRETTYASLTRINSVFFLVSLMLYLTTYKIIHTDAE